MKPPRALQFVNCERRLQFVKGRIADVQTRRPDVDFVVTEFRRPPDLLVGRRLPDLKIQG